MQIGEIISEADVLVPNEVSTADKVIVLNALNRDFFNVVKIPLVLNFTPIKNQTDYLVASQIRQKNIEFITVGLIKYKELTALTSNALQNTFTFDDNTSSLFLSPAPYAEGLQGIIRFNRVATTTFVPGVLTDIPDMPEEYHYSLVLGLAAYLAQTQDDGAKAGNYENQYKAMWNVAAQNYAKGVTQ